MPRLPGHSCVGGAGRRLWEPPAPGAVEPAGEVGR